MNKTRNIKSVTQPIEFLFSGNLTRVLRTQTKKMNSAVNSYLSNGLAECETLRKELYKEIDKQISELIKQYRLFEDRTFYFNSLEEQAHIQLNSSFFEEAKIYDHMTKESLELKSKLDNTKFYFQDLLSICKSFSVDKVQISNNNSVNNITSKINSSKTPNKKEDIQNENPEVESEKKENQIVIPELIPKIVRKIKMSYNRQNYSDILLNPAYKEVYKSLLTKKIYSGQILKLVNHLDERFTKILLPRTGVNLKHDLMNKYNKRMSFDLTSLSGGYKETLLYTRLRRHGKGNYMKMTVTPNNTLAFERERLTTFKGYFTYFYMVKVGDQFRFWGKAAAASLMQRFYREALHCDSISAWDIQFYVYEEDIFKKFENLEGDVDDLNISDELLKELRDRRYALSCVRSAFIEIIMTEIKKNYG